jgi:hypothetical protein
VVRHRHWQHWRPRWCRPCAWEICWAGGREPAGDSRPRSDRGPCGWTSARRDRLPYGWARARSGRAGCSWVAVTGAGSLGRSCQRRSGHAADGWRRVLSAGSDVGAGWCAEFRPASRTGGRITRRRGRERAELEKIGALRAAARGGRTLRKFGGLPQRSGENGPCRTPLLWPTIGAGPPLTVSRLGALRRGTRGGGANPRPLPCLPGGAIPPESERVGAPDAREGRRRSCSPTGGSTPA